MSKTIVRNVYEEITQRIIDALEAGVIPWSRPWEMARYGVHRNAVTGRPYRGLNVVLLNLVASMRGFVDPRWLTYKNAEMVGGHVKKGEKGVGIVFWKFNPVAEIIENADDEDNRRTIPLTRMYTVFNIEQCDGIGLPALEKTDVEYKNNEGAEKILMLPTMKHGGDMSFYSKNRDCIVMPIREAFENLDFYYSTFYHEILHWTGHPCRLNRTFGARFGDQEYAFEELVAEIGAAFIGANTGVPFENMRHPEYINTWLQILNKDNRAIFTAAAKAQSASDYILEIAGMSVPVISNLPVQPHMNQIIRSLASLS